MNLSLLTVEPPSISCYFILPIQVRRIIYQSRRLYAVKTRDILVAADFPDSSAQL